MTTSPSLRTHIAQFSIVLLLFAICHFLSLYVFYNGFLINFNRFSTTLNPYLSSSILLSSLLHPLFMGTLLLFYLPLLLKRKVFYYKQFSYTWSNKLIVFTGAFLLTWELTTYDYNYYLNNAFYFDRIILIILTLLLLRSPLFLPLFIAWTYLYRSQFNYPIDGFTLFDKQLLFDILIMYVAYMYVKIFFPITKISFLFLAICIVASNYFMCAIAKIFISPHGYEWLLSNNPINLFYNVHSRGWLSQSTENTINALSSFLSNYGRFFQTAILFIEFSALFLLRTRKLTLVLLFCFCALHIGIFIFGSMLFWKWMCIDLILIWILIRDKSTDEELYSKNLFLSSIILISFSFLWLKPVRIGWYDTPVNQFFTYEVVDIEGKTFEFDKNQMNPYHQWFQYDQFLFLVNEPCLPVSGFGYTMNYKIAQAIKNSTPEMYPQLEQEYGKNHYDIIKKERYDDFIKIYFFNRNHLLGKTFIPFRLAAPYHLYSEANTPYNNKSPIHLFKVILNKVVLKNGKTIVINKKTIDEITIPN